MTKKCPNCRIEIDKELTICPGCGYLFEAIDSKKTLKQSNESKNEEQDISDFSLTEQNETIEWSDLKDVSIGHVMSMFNDQQSKELDEKKAKEEKETLEIKAASSLDSIEESLIEEELSNNQNTTTSSTKIEDQRAEKLSEETVEEKQVDVKEVSLDEFIQESTDEIIITEEIKDSSLNSDKQPEVTDLNPLNDSHSNDSANASFKYKNQEGKMIGPKNLPKEIPTKSKKPEEIELDDAPIFFKDIDEQPNQKQTKPSDDLFSDRRIEKEPLPVEFKEKPINKKYKKVAIVLVSAVILTGGVWLSYHQLSEHFSSQTQQTKQQTEIEEVKAELTNYFTDDTALFIKPEMVTISPTAIKDKLENLKNTSEYNQLNSIYEKINEKQAAIKTVNALFTQPIINGNQLADVSLKEDTAIALTDRNATDAFDDLINQAIHQAKEQYNQLETAKSAVNVIYQDGKFTASLSQDTYNTAKTEVDKIKNVALRTPLSNILVEANLILSELKATTPSSDDATITGNTAETGTVTVPNSTENTPTTQPDQNTFSAPNAEGVYTDPVYTVNPTDVADTTNPAWVWADGIQERVIGICIQRGYIVADQYSLQPARIINGEGYYNLYNSSGQYLVTINDKTGWFKGNASRNAGR